MTNSILESIILEINSETNLDASDRIITCDDLGFLVEFAYDSSLVIAIKEIAGAKYSKQIKKWIIPRSSASLLAKFGVAYHFSGLDLVKEATKEENEIVKESFAEDADIDTSRLKRNLMAYQRAGVKYALNRRRVLIGDEMGLGKTVQALAACLLDGAFDSKKSGGVVVVCPASLKRNWYREVKLWLPDSIDAVIIDGKKKSDYLGDVVIVNYDILESHLDALVERNFAGCIVDESHFVKNPTAKRTKSVTKLARSVKENGLILALTGTPIVNRPNELVSQLRVLNRLDEVFGGYWPFVKRYCAARKGQFGWDVSGSSNLDELNERLRASCYVRRLKENVLADLPAKERRQLWLDASAEDFAKYQLAQDDVLAWLREQAKEVLINAGDDPDEQKAALLAWAKANSNNAEHLRRIATLRQLAGQAKVAPAIEWINRFLEESERKIVVFAHHVSVVDALAKAFGDSAVRISGSVALSKRQEAVDSFQNNKKTRVFVGNIDAAGVGITLTAASDVLFVEQGWTPAQHDQAEDRCHRIGQRDSVTAWYGLLGNSIDEEMTELIDKKRSVVTQVTNGEQGSSNAALIANLLEKVSV